MSDSEHEPDPAPTSPTGGSNTQTEAGRLQSADAGGAQTDDTRNIIRSSRSLILDLADAMIASAIPSSIASDLTAGKCVVIVLDICDVSWIEPIEEILRNRWPAVNILARREEQPIKSWTNETTWQAMNTEPVIILSHDPDALVPSSMLAAADMRFSVRAPKRVAVAGLIEELSGSKPLGLRSTDLAELTAFELVACLRPGCAADMVKRIRRIAASRVKSTKIRHAAPPGPGISDLVLPDNIARWSSFAAHQLSLANAQGLEGVLIEGPPGTGKTTLATALAHEAGVPMVATNVATWFTGSKGYLHDVLQEISRFADDVVASAPAVAVIDEIDSVPNRGALATEFDPYWVTVTNAVLTAIDRINASGLPIQLIGITNFAARLDPALVRAGRLGRRLTLPLPQNAAQRLTMLRLHLPNGLRDAELDVLMPFLGERSPADLRQVAVEAQALAIAQGREFTSDHLRAVLLPPDHRPLALRRLIATHEAGHAIMARLMGLAVKSVSILPEDNSGGATDIEGMAVDPVTLESTEKDALVLLAGRAADIVFSGAATSGAAEDLRRVGQLLTDAALRLGLAGQLLPTPQGAQIGQWLNDYEYRDAIEKRAQDLLGIAKSMLQDHADAVAATAEALLERIILDRAAFEAVIRPFDLSRRVAPPPEMGEGL